MLIVAIITTIEDNIILIFDKDSSFLKSQPIIEISMATKMPNTIASSKHLDFPFYPSWKA